MRGNCESRPAELTNDEVERRVALRMRRQKVPARPDAPAVGCDRRSRTAPTARRQAGDNGADRASPRAHLANITLQVMPYHLGGSIAEGAFTSQPLPGGGGVEPAGGQALPRGCGSWRRSKPPGGHSSRPPTLSSARAGSESASASSRGWPWPAATDVAGFYAQREPAPCPDADVLVLTCDGKGIVMHPQALREATAKAARSAGRKLATRLSPGGETRPQADGRTRQRL